MATLDVDGANLYYREAGSGSPLLLIHGSGTHADCFDGAVRTLAEHHRVIVYDRRGHSRSSPGLAPVQGYLARQADDAAGLLSRLGAAPATVLGWSTGGVIALFLALNHPELVSRLVLYEPPLHAARHMPLSALWPFLKAQFLAAIGRERAAAATFLRMSLAQTDGSNAFDDADAATREAVLVNARVMLHELKTGTGEELTAERIRALACPVSAILGAKSSSVLTHATQRLSAMLPAMPVRSLAGAGHVAMLTHPEEFARLALQS